MNIKLKNDNFPVFFLTERRIKRIFNNENYVQLGPFDYFYDYFFNHSLKNNSLKCLQSELQQKNKKNSKNDLIDILEQMQIKTGNTRSLFSYQKNYDHYDLFFNDRFLSSTEYEPFKIPCKKSALNNEMQHYPTILPKVKLGWGATAKEKLVNGAKYASHKTGIFDTDKSLVDQLSLLLKEEKKCFFNEEMLNYVIQKSNKLALDKIEKDKTFDFFSLDFNQILSPSMWYEQICNLLRVKPNTIIIVIMSLILLSFLGNWIVSAVPLLSYISQLFPQINKIWEKIWILIPLPMYLKDKISAFFKDEIQENIDIKSTEVLLNLLNIASYSPKCLSYLHKELEELIKNSNRKNQEEKLLSFYDALFFDKQKDILQHITDFLHLEKGDANIKKELSEFMLILHYIINKENHEMKALTPYFMYLEQYCPQRLSGSLGFHKLLLEKARQENVYLEWMFYCIDNNQLKNVKLLPNIFNTLSVYQEKCDTNRRKKDIHRLLHYLYVHHEEDRDKIVEFQVESNDDYLFAEHNLLQDDYHQRLLKYSRKKDEATCKKWLDIIARNMNLENNLLDFICYLSNLLGKELASYLEYFLKNKTTEELEEFVKRLILNGIPLENMASKRLYSVMSVDQFFIELVKVEDKTVQTGCLEKYLKFKNNSNNVVFQKEIAKNCLKYKIDDSVMIGYDFYRYVCELKLRDADYSFLTNKEVIEYLFFNNKNELKKQNIEALLNLSWLEKPCSLNETLCQCLLDSHGDAIKGDASDKLELLLDLFYSSEKLFLNALPHDNSDLNIKWFNLFINTVVLSTSPPESFEKRYHFISKSLGERFNPKEIGKIQQYIINFILKSIQQDVRFLLKIDSKIMYYFIKDFSIDEVSVIKKEKQRFDYFLSQETEKKDKNSYLKLLDKYSHFTAPFIILPYLLSVSDFRMPRNKNRLNCSFRLFMLTAVLSLAAQEKEAEKKRQYKDVFFELFTSYANSSSVDKTVFLDRDVYDNNILHITGLLEENWLTELCKNMFFTSSILLETNRALVQKNMTGDNFALLQSGVMNLSMIQDILKMVFEHDSKQNKLKYTLKNSLYQMNILGLNFFSAFCLVDIDEDHPLYEQYINTFDMMLQYIKSDSTFMPMLIAQNCVGEGPLTIAVKKGALFMVEKLIQAIEEKKIPLGLVNESLGLLNKDAKCFFNKDKKNPLYFAVYLAKGKELTEKKAAIVMRLIESGFFSGSSRIKEQANFCRNKDIKKKINDLSSDKNINEYGIDSVDVVVKDSNIIDGYSLKNSRITLDETPYYINDFIYYFHIGEYFKIFYKDQKTLVIKYQDTDLEVSEFKRYIDNSIKFLKEGNLSSDENAKRFNFIGEYHKKYLQFNDMNNKVVLATEIEAENRITGQKYFIFSFEKEEEEEEKYYQLHLLELLENQGIPLEYQYHVNAEVKNNLKVLINNQVICELSFASSNVEKRLFIEHERKQEFKLSSFFEQLNMKQNEI